MAFSQMHHSSLLKCRNDGGATVDDDQKNRRENCAGRVVHPHGQLNSIRPVQQVNPVRSPNVPGTISATAELSTGRGVITFQGGESR